MYIRYKKDRMSSKIRVLDEHTINKIAAGEVIENAASVIKELVENSLDAGSTDICIEIKGGGRQLIRITDNGCGMSGDDALLCLERHATSKIRSVEDIHDMISMGFRGEAIPSIAAISKFSILTRPPEKDNTEGTLVLVEGGKILKCCPAACSSGTTIEVKSLFFNVPVRKKFQRSPAYDTNEIVKIITLLSLGYPQVKFRLISDQETLLSAPHPSTQDFLGQLKERIGAVLGGDYAEGTLSVEGSSDDYHIRGWIGMPHLHKQNRTGQYLFINQRGIQSPLVSFAIKDGYGTAISAQRHPVYVLHLTMPGSLVDVNVHPQKKEVRLRQEQTLRELLVGSVREALQKGGKEKEIFQALPESHVQPRAFPQPTFYSFSDAPAFEAFTPPAALPGPEPLKKQAAQLQTEAMPLILHLPPAKTAPRVIAAIPRYLILEGPPGDTQGSPRGLCLVDQCAAHARIVYERICSQASQSPLEIQQLLIPHTIELTAIDAECLRRNLSLLEKYGIHLKEFGRLSFILDGLPEVMGNLDPAFLVKEMIALLHETNGHSDLQQQFDRRFAMAAVRASVSKDRRLSLPEGQALISQLIMCTSPWHCPLGKPTLVTLAPEEISKYFS